MDARRSMWGRDAETIRGDVRVGGEEVGNFRWHATWTEGSVAHPSQSRLVRDAGGAVAVEYTMILIFVALPVAAALAAAGVIMLDEYRLARDLILLPVP